MGGGGGERGVDRGGVCQEARGLASGQKRAGNGTGDPTMPNDGVITQYLRCMIISMLTWVMFSTKLAHQ